MPNKITNFILASYGDFSQRTWINILAVLINALGNMAVTFMALYLVTRLHFSAKQTSHVVSAYSLGLVLGAYLGGYFCEKFSPYILSIFSLIAAGIAIISFSFFHHYLFLIILAVGIGFFYGMFKPANILLLIAEHSEVEQTRIMGLYRMAVNLGNGFATAVGGILATLHYHLIFWVDGVSTFLAALLLIKRKQLFVNLKIDTEPKQKANLITVLKNQIFLLGCAVLFVSSIVFYQIQFSYPLYLHQKYFMSTQVFGYLFFMNCILIVLLQLPLLHILRNMEQLWIALVGAIFLALGFFILPFGKGTLFAFISCIIWTLGEMLLYPILFTVTINAVVDTARTKAVSIYQVVYTGAAVIAPIMGGYLYHYEDGNVLWYLCALVGFLMAILLIKLRQLLLIPSKLNCA